MTENFKLVSGKPASTTHLLKDPKMFAEMSSLLKPYMVSFDIKRFYGLGPQSKHVQIPMIIVDRKHLPVADITSINEISYSVQSSVLLGHSLICIDLLNEITHEQKHLVINFCPLDYLQNNDRYRDYIGVLKLIEQAGMLILINKEFAEYLSSTDITMKDFIREVQSGERGTLVTLQKFSLEPLLVNALMWNNMLEKYPFMKNIDTFDNLQYLWKELDMMFFDINVESLCDTCSQIFKEMETKKK